MARKPPSTRKTRSPNSAQKWSLVSKVPFGGEFLYTYVCRYGRNEIQTVQVVEVNATAALRQAKAQFRGSAAFYAYSYRYGSYTYAYGYAYAYAYGNYAYGDYASPYTYGAGFGVRSGYGHGGGAD